MTRHLFAAIAAILISTAALAQNKISLKKPGARKAPATALFYESFEQGIPAGKQTSDWLPEGWTRTSNPVVEDPYDYSFWYVSRCNPYFMPAPADGNQFMVVLYDKRFKDERIITPEIEVTGKGYELSYYWYSQPLYLFVIDEEHVDFDAGEFKKQEVAANLEVLVQVEGSNEWEKIDDLAEKYKNLSYTEMLLESKQFSGMQRAAVNLDRYAGRKIKVAFRYVGTDGDSFFLDAVGIDHAPLTARYSAPLYRQFYGFSLDGELDWMPVSMEYYPAGTQITWENTSSNDVKTTYQWTYTDPNTGQETTADSQDQLTVTYDVSKMLPLDGGQLYWYSTPTLTASAEGRSSGSYRAKAEYMQIGGKAGINGIDSDGKPYEKSFGLLPFDCYNEGCDIYVKEPFDFGRNDIPIFGYSEDTDRWWSNYTFNGEERPNEYSYCSGFMNWVQLAPGKKMIMNGANVAAVGKIDDDARFRLEVRAVNDDGEIIETPVAVAHTTGKDVKKFDRGTLTKYLSLNFRFDRPLILDAEAHPAGYLVEVTGYHDGGVTYFAPMQSMEPNEDELCLGFYRFHAKYQGQEFDSYSYCAFFQTEDGRDLYTTFAISLDAYYPLSDKEIDDIYAGISDVVVSKPASSEVFNLQGMRISKPSSAGIYIKNGKKMLVK